MTALTKGQILEMIPHRDPFVWVDEVQELTPTKITATKFLDPGLDVFRGHYPNFPVLPGVLQCEMCLQAGALLIAQLEKVAEGQVPVATRINNVKFKHMVKPGDTVQITAELTEKLANAYYLTGKVTVNGKTATTLEFACTATAVG
ncbi:MAG: 3-hydroxyacyl-ACP dehydratase FabZ family protein [Planctomycetales bacterium]